MVDELAYHVFIQATAQDVWDALTGPGWPRKYGYRTLVKYDTRPDGVYLAYASGRRYGQRAGDLVISGEVLEAEPPKRLVQTWHPMFDATAAAEPELDPPGGTMGTFLSSSAGAYGFFTWPPSEL